jgi:hypothetical protein
MNSDKKDQEKLFSCPYLGIHQDPNTAMAFPSTQNSCHKIKPARVPTENHQNQFCLSPNFNECKVYKEKGKTSDKKYPGIFTKEKSRLAKILPKLIVASILLLVIGFVLFQLGSKGKLSLLNQLISPRSSSLPAWTEPTANIEIIPTDSATATATHAPVKRHPRNLSKPRWENSKCSLSTVYCLVKVSVRSQNSIKPHLKLSWPLIMAWVKPYGWIHWW